MILNSSNSSSLLAVVGRSGEKYWPLFWVAKVVLTQDHTISIQIPSAEVEDARKLLSHENAVALSHLHPLRQVRAEAPETVRQDLPN